MTILTYQYIRVDEKVLQSDNRPLQRCVHNGANTVSYNSILKNKKRTDLIHTHFWCLIMPNFNCCATDLYVIINKTHFI